MSNAFLVDSVNMTSLCSCKIAVVFSEVHDKLARKTLQLTHHFCGSWVSCWNYSGL